MTPRKRRSWSKTVEEQGVAVRVYERAAGGALYVEVRQGGTKKRSSLKHTDRALGESQARQVARRLAELRHAGHLGPVTLGEVRRFYTEHRLPLLSPKRQQNARTAAQLLTRHLGDGFVLEHLGQAHVDAYVAARRAGTLSPRPQPAAGSPQRPTGVRHGTIGQELRWLSALCTWAHTFRVGGKRLLAENPLRGLKWPEEVNPRRPVASEDRFRRTLAQADAVDALGRLRGMLALARYTGRRENAICQLRASDVLLTRDQVLRVLAATGLDERLADHMPSGAIYWRPDADKRSYEEVTAISPAARAALETYLRAHPRVGDAPLFPAATDASRPIHKDVAARLLLEAERRAKLPKLERGRFHPYRRLFAVEGKHLPDVDVAKAAGWRDLRTMKQSYQRPDPATVLKVIETVGGGLTSDTPQKASTGETPT
jgi:hypothetical protein